MMLKIDVCESEFKGWGMGFFNQWKKKSVSKGNNMQ